MDCYGYKSKVHRFLWLQSFSPCIPTPIRQGKSFVTVFLLLVFPHSFVITCKKSLPHIYHGTPTGPGFVSSLTADHHLPINLNQYQWIVVVILSFPPYHCVVIVLKYRLRHKICSEWAVSANRLIWTNLTTTSSWAVVVLLISLVCCIVDGWSVSKGPMLCRGPMYLSLFIL